MTAYTIGHSTRALEKLIALLERHGVRVLADVRRWPASRRHPQHARASLERALPPRGIAYEWWGDRLGGYRAEIVPAGQSLNAAWDTAGFRNYADYLLTEEGRAALDALEARAREAPLAILCAEAQWWRCHRRLLADHLVARGHRVLDIMEGGATEHALPRFARAEGGRVTYPGKETGDAERSAS